MKHRINSQKPSQEYVVGIVVEERYFAGIATTSESVNASEVTDNH